MDEVSKTEFKGFFIDEIVAITWNEILDKIAEDFSKKNRDPIIRYPDDLHLTVRRWGEGDGFLEMTVDNRRIVGKDGHRNHRVTVLIASGIPIEDLVKEKPIPEGPNIWRKRLPLDISKKRTLKNITSLINENLLRIWESPNVPVPTK
ncbi:MAG: hypothetical protein ABH812_04045 [bacterium]